MGGGKHTNGYTILRLLKKHKSKCFYCGVKVKLNSYNQDNIQKDNKATIEHVYPKSDIRRFVSKKKVLACYKCNHAKGRKDYDLVYNNETYRDIFYKNNEDCIYNGLIISMLQSNDVTKYLF